MGRPFLLEKSCSKCKKIFPSTSEYFYYRNKKKGYLQSFCKSCKKVHRQENWSKELKCQQKRRGNRPIETIKFSNADYSKKGCHVCGTKNKGHGTWYCRPCHKKLKAEKKRKDKCLYKSRLRKAKPKWVDGKEIKRIYSQRPEGHHVDHIIPIRGDGVCGLHVPWNLQYLTAEKNMAKSNHYSLQHNGRR